MEPKWWALFGWVQSTNLICFVKGFMIASIGMAVAHRHDVSYDRCFIIIIHTPVSFPSLHSYSLVFMVSHCTLKNEFAETLYSCPMITLCG